MAATYGLISSYTVSGSSTSSFTFNSIPNTFDDLIIYISDRVNTGGSYDVDKHLQYNAQSTPSAYSGRFAYVLPSSGNSLPTQTTSPTNIWASSTNNTASNYFSVNWTYIANYNSAISASRPYFGYSGYADGIIIFGTSRPGNAEAITSLTFKQNASLNFISGSTFYLYGIKNS